MAKIYYEIFFQTWYCCRFCNLGNGMVFGFKKSRFLTKDEVQGQLTKLAFCSIKTFYWLVLQGVDLVARNQLQFWNLGEERNDYD